MKSRVLRQMIQNSQTGRLSFEEHSEVSIDHAVVGYGGLAYFHHGGATLDCDRHIETVSINFPQCAGYR